MLSLRVRLWILWAVALAASVVVGVVLVQLSGISAQAQRGRAEVAALQGCDTIRDRYRFYVAGWDGAGARPDRGFGSALEPVLAAALATEPGMQGGIWSRGAGTIAALPAPSKPGRLAAISAASSDAVDGEQAVLQRLAGPGRNDAGDGAGNGGGGEVLLAACPLPGPVPGLAAWTISRVAADGADALRLGLGVLLLLLVGLAAWVAWLTASWGRHVRRIEAALSAHALEALPILAATGEPELDRIVAALNEASARTQAMMRQAEAAERLAALGRVAAGVAHEIRNPIAAIRLRAENALAGDVGRQRAALEASLPQIARVDRLVTELLAMSQRRAPCLEEVDLATFLENRAASHRQAGRAPVRVSGEGPARFDPELIGRALDNLLLNALRHTPADGMVALRAERMPGRLRIVVEDTGPGIDPTLRDRLFEPFATSRPDGTGLGLAIAREMADAHGGSLTLSDDVDAGQEWERGARFRLDLPQEDRCRPS